MSGLALPFVFAGFYSLPLLVKVLLRVYHFTVEHMGVAADHFGGDGFNYIIKVEEVFLLVEIVEKNNLEKKIPQFLADVAGIVFIDCLEQFVGLLDKILLEGLGGLLFIPGAPVRSPEAAGNFKEGKKFFRGVFHEVAFAGVKGGADSDKRAERRDIPP